MTIWLLWGKVPLSLPLTGWSVMLWPPRPLESSLEMTWCRTDGVVPVAIWGPSFLMKILQGLSFQRNNHKLLPSCPVPQCNFVNLPWMIHRLIFKSISLLSGRITLHADINHWIKEWLSSLCWTVAYNFCLRAGCVMLAMSFEICSCSRIARSQSETIGWALGEKALLKWGAQMQAMHLSDLKVWSLDPFLTLI